VLGLFTRPVAFFPVINMGEAALLYCFIFLYLAAPAPALRRSTETDGQRNYAATRPPTGWPRRRRQKSQETMAKLNAFHKTPFRNAIRYELVRSKMTPEK
jgi:hypothetical protein